MKTPKSIQTAESRASRDELLDVAWDVARRFTEFGAYGSKVKACNALQRRCKGFTQEEYSSAFEGAISLLDAAIEVVTRNTELFWKQWETQQQEPKHIDFQGIDKELQQKHPQFPIAVCQSVLNWVFFWHHLK